MPEHGVCSIPMQHRQLARLRLRFGVANRFLSFSGHTFHGPQGPGYYARTRDNFIDVLGAPRIWTQAGTENVPGIVGLGKAAEIRHDA